MSSNFTTKDITTLTEQQSVQMRPGMYLGNVARDAESPGQKNVCVRELLDNSVLEALNKYADHVWLTFNNDGSFSIEDNGRGLPVDYDENTGENGIIKTLGHLHSGANFVQKEEKHGAGLNGVGASCCNFMSDKFNVTVYRGKKIYQLNFHNGVPGYFDNDVWVEDNSLKISKNDKKQQGTLIDVKFNDDYFSKVENIIVDDIIDRCRYIVYIVPGLKITITDNTRTSEDGGGVYEFEGENGVNGLVEFVGGKDPVNITCIGSYTINAVDINGKTHEEKRKVPINLSFGSTDNDGEVLSFVNTIRTKSGGVHEKALKQALVDTFGKIVNE